MKFRTDESFLFPASQLDFKRDHILFPQGGLHGFGASPNTSVPGFGNVDIYLKDFEERSFLANFPNTPVQDNGMVLRSDTIELQMIADPNLAADADLQKLLRALRQAESSLGIARSQTIAMAQQNTAEAAARSAAAAAQATQEIIARNAATVAAQQAAAAAQADAVAKAAAATANAQAVQAVIDAQLAAQQAAARAATTTTTAAVTVDYFLDSDGSIEFVIERRNNGTPTVVAGKSGLPTVDAWLTSRNLTRDPMNKTAAFNTFDTARRTAAAAATTTQKTAVDTSTGTVKTVDTASGTTSTVNAATGSVRLTLSDGTTATGTGSVTAGGVTTKVDTTTGVVTTQNTQTGVATQTNAGTGQTQTGTQVTGTAATGGTFILPDGKTTVTTTQPITGGGLSAGHLALVGLVGLLLLRGAIK
jgi:hypothetical protein